MAQFYDGTRMRERLPGERSLYSALGVIAKLLAGFFMLLWKLTFGRGGIAAALMVIITVVLVIFLIDRFSPGFADFVACMGEPSLRPCTW